MLKFILLLKLKNSFKKIKLRLLISPFTPLNLILLRTLNMPLKY